jgi:flagellar hook-associated protein 3 FlgL
MSTPRITQRLMVSQSLTALQTGLNRLSTTQEQLSSGRQINRPSDSPTGTNDAMRIRAQLAANDQYTRNAQDGLSWMGQTDSTLTSMMDDVRRARDLLVQGASTGSNGPDARAAIATELGQIRDSLVGLANTEYLGRPIFGGTTGSTAAYTQDATGAVTFQGDQHAVNRTVGNGTSVQINVTGPAAFSANGDDLFKVLGDAISQLTSDPGALGGTLTRLDAVAQQMTTAQADLGARYSRVESAVNDLSSATLNNQTALSNIENVDLAQATMDLQLQQVAYQASLGATARVIQPSLLDFLH